MGSARVRDGRRRGWFWMDNVIVDHFAASLPSASLAVYMVLCRHASNDDRTAVLSIGRIGEKLGISRSTVKRALAGLEEARLISVEYRFNGEEQQASSYVLLDPVIAEDLGGVSPVTPVHQWTGVQSDTPPGVSEWTDPGSPVDHLNKDSFEKDQLVKDVADMPFGVLMEAWYRLRVSGRDSRSAVSAGVLTEDECAGLLAHGRLRLVVEQHDRRFALA